MSRAADTGSATEARWRREGYEGYRPGEHIGHGDKPLFVRAFLYYHRWQCGHRLCRWEDGQQGRKLEQRTWELKRRVYRTRLASRHGWVRVIVEDVSMDAYPPMLLA